MQPFRALSTFELQGLFGCIAYMLHDLSRLGSIAFMQAGRFGERVWMISIEQYGN